MESPFYKVYTDFLIDYSKSICESFSFLFFKMKRRILKDSFNKVISNLLAAHRTFSNFSFLFLHDVNLFFDCSF